PSPCFPFPSNEGNGAPGGAREVCETSLGRHCDLPTCTPSFRDPSLEGGGGPGARGPVRRARRLPALHRGTHCRRPHLASSSAVAIDDALDWARHAVSTGSEGPNKRNA